MKSLAALLTAALFCAHAMAADAPAAPKKPDPAKGATFFTTAKEGQDQDPKKICFSCHGSDAASPITPLYPKLADQHPEYLLKQLQEFKSGARQEPTMQAMAAPLSDEDMHDIAAWVASQKAKPGVAADPALVKVGERIYRGGIADRHIPACAGCHSPNGAGIPAQYPRLAGQQPEYTVKQLVAFRDATRTNNVQMTGVAAKLNDHEIKAVADYIAGLR